MNLVTGQWEVTLSTFREVRQSGKITGAAIAARDWDVTRALPAPCTAASGQLYADAAICMAENPPEACGTLEE